MAAQHGNVIVRRQGGGDVDYFVRRDRSEVACPWGSAPQRAADATRIYVVPWSGDVQVRDGTRDTAPLLSTIPRPSGAFDFGVANAGPSGLWVPVHDMGDARADASLRWDGSSWTRHPGAGAGDNNPTQNFHLPTATGFYYCHGAGTLTSAPLKHRTTAGTVTTINDNTALSAFAGTTVTGTRHGVAQTADWLFMPFTANVGAPTWSGIWRLTHAGVPDALIQFSGYDRGEHRAVVTDCEGGLWAQARHTATSVFHLIRFEPDGTIIDAWAPTFPMSAYGLWRGPRLGPISRLWTGRSVIGAGAGLT